MPVLWRVQSDSLSHNIHSDISFLHLILIIQKLENLKREENDTGTPGTAEGFVPQNFKLMIDHRFIGAMFMCPALLLALLCAYVRDKH